MKTSISESYIDYDFSSIKVTSFELENEPVGFTVVLCDKPMSFSINKKGKMIGSCGTDQLYGTKSMGTHSIVFTGGSVQGLECIAGVTKALFEKQKHKWPTRAMGACIWSNNINSKRAWEYPSLTNGYESISNMEYGKVFLGQVGAGLSAKIGKIYTDREKYMVDGGQGVAFSKIGNVRILVITIINSLGVVHKDKKLLHPFGTKGKNIKTIDDMPSFGGLNQTNSNTTLTMCITNTQMSESAMEKISNDLHNTVESRVYPFGTKYDGDILFFASTDEIKVKIDDNIKNKMKDCVNRAIDSLFIK